MHHRPSRVAKVDPASQGMWEEHLEDPAFVNLIPSWASMASFLEQ